MAGKTHFPATGAYRWAQFLSFYFDGATTGNVWFVNSATGTDSTGFGSSPEAPFASINYAVGQCVANNGDRVYVMPGHAETVAAGGTLALATAGVEVVGLGVGSNRPTITLAGTASTIPVSAANVTLRNVIVKVSITEVVSCFNVTAPFCTLDRVDFVETTSKKLIQFLVTSALGTDLVISNCKHHQGVAPVANSLWIQLIGADRAKITGNQFFLTTTNSASSSVIESDTTAPANILIANNWIVQLGGASVIPVKLVAATSGFVANNTVASPKTTIAGSIACASCYAAGNLAGHVVNTSGILEPAADA